MGKTVYSNLFFLETTRNPGRWGGEEYGDRLSFKGATPKLTDIDGSTVVYVNDNFRVQSSEPEKAGYGIFYIQKYQKILTNPQFCDFIKSHPDEKFLVMDNTHGNATHFWAYTVSEPNQLTLHIFNKMDDVAVMKEVAILRTKFGTVEWEKPEILDDRVKIEAYTDNEGKENECTRHYFSVKGYGSKHYDYASSSYRIGEEDISWINYDDNHYETKDIINRALNIPGQTRVLCKYNGGDSYSYEITANKFSLLDPTVRYGIRGDASDRTYSWYIRDRFHTDEEPFPDLPLDEETMSRVKTFMTTVLKNLQKQNPFHVFWETNLVVLDKPIPGHRRPTYHFLHGILTADTVDVVDVCRGELQIEGMEPVNCYHLRGEDGKYYRISHNFFGKIKSNIKEAEIDVTSFEEWNDTRAVHPELVATLSKYGDKSVDLTLIRLLNTLPFGVTFIEQLIKTDHVQLGHYLARKIRTEADNPNYRCSSLTDILPGVNPDGTTILEVMNMTKPCYNYLMEDIDETNSSLGKFIAKYKAVKCFLPDGIFTSAGSKSVEEYMWLYNKNKHYTQGLVHCEIIDFINYPEEVKTIYKMYQKIDRVFKGDALWDATRKYSEIVGAYIKMKNIGFNPSEQLVFLEFGLGMGVKEALDMLDRREKAANNAIENCRAKLEEPIRQAVEKTYDSRKAAIKKLESDKKLEKDPAFEKYIVIAPSRIYDKEDTRSIEHEGRYMDHCVYNAYSKDIANGEYTVVYLRSKTSPEDGLVTIGIDERGRINQTYTFHDRGISKEQAAAIVAWAKSKEGLVWFNTDSGAVCPGGWNCSVPVPALARPDPEYIKKLSTVKVAEVEKPEL